MPNRYQKAKFKFITRRYGLHLIRISTHDSLYKKNAVYCATTNRGKSLVKELNTRSLGKTLPQEKFFSYVRKLKTSKYPNTPRWLKTRTGEYSVNWHGRPYYMTEWISGRKITDDVHDYESLGRALAHLHNLRKVQHTPTPAYTHQRIKDFKHQGHLFHRQLKGFQQKKTTSSRWFDRFGESCVRLTHEAWRIIDDPDVKRILLKERWHPALIHGDVTIPNIVIHSGRLFLIDWDCLRTGSKYYEVVKTLSNTTYYNPVLMDAFLQGYEEVRPFKSPERLLISALFRLPREAWNVARKIGSGRSDQGLKLLGVTWYDRLDAIRHLDEWAKEGSIISASEHQI
ncbi:phosphotransferase [Paenibacillus glacialis]|uniref:Aminoglycoside phosphotransferase domain-containing protein n=1 Tax=Paenibacillus glacialis TaxID=494026 RepID=A0A168F7V8_9BACL|nr:phosphotransferase [Paenibacillus glacialis]OAB35946.1 hypothetical protein PGLA_21200 [Paenibacillus glacialis]